MERSHSSLDAIQIKTSYETKKEKESWQLKPTKKVFMKTDPQFNCQIYNVSLMMKLVSESGSNKTR